MIHLVFYHHLVANVWLGCVDNSAQIVAIIFPWGFNVKGV